MVFTTLIERNNEEVVSQDDPWTIFAGTRRASGKDVYVSYALIYRDIQKVDQDGKLINDAPIHDLAIHCKGAQIRFQGDELMPDRKLEKSMNATFSDPPSLPPNGEAQHLTICARNI